MNTFADSALAADQCPCGPDCTCAASDPVEADDFESRVLNLTNILSEVDGCPCEDCTEIMFIAQTAFEFGREYQQDLVDEIIEEAKTNAFKSGLDTGALNPTFESDEYEYDFDFPLAPAISYEDVPPVNWQNEDEPCDCAICTGELVFDLFDEDGDIGGSDSDPESESLSVADVAGLVADLADVVGTLSALVAGDFNSIDDQIAYLRDVVADLQKDIQTIDERQEADVALLDVINDRLLGVEAKVADNFDW